MATPKKPVGKALSKKAAPAPAKKKAPLAKAVPAKKTAEAQKSAVKKVAQAKSAAPAKKAAAKASVPQPLQSKKSTSSPAKATAAAKAAAPKKAAPAKAAPAARNAPAKPAATAKPTAKAPVPEKKAAAPAAKPSPAKKSESKKDVAVVNDPAAVVVKKETKAEKKAALKRTASAVQRVQARIAASATAKLQPKPAPMPTIMPGRDEKKSNVIVAHRRISNKPKEEPVDTSLTMTEYQPEYKRSILDKEDKETGPTYRYSDEDLNEFKELITGRLATARKELAYQQGLITHRDASGAEDTDNRYMNMEDGSGAMEREQLAQLASRQIQFINHLEKALIRIENKTYGICRITGKLIDKARLRAVPHATLSIEAKNMMSNK